MSELQHVRFVKYPAAAGDEWAKDVFTGRVPPVGEHIIIRENDDESKSDMFEVKRITTSYLDFKRPDMPQLGKSMITVEVMNVDPSWNPPKQLR